MTSFRVFSLAVLVSVFLAFIALQPPTPKSVEIDTNKFSSARAMKDVRVIAAKPHPTGSAENKVVRDYIAGQLTSLGLKVEESASMIIDDPNEKFDPVDRLNRWSGQNLKEQTIYNVIGVLPGKDRAKPAILLMAHHDTVWESPGASDDTIGVAVILEVLRAIKDEPRERDVIVLITDAEELGLSGARNFFANNPLKDRVGAIINLEARGAGGTANLFQLNRGNGEAARFYARHVNEPSISSLSAYVYERLPNDTDLTPALEDDYIAYNMAIIGKAGMYHSPKITADELAENSVQHMGSQTLDLTRALINHDIPAQSSDATFFDAFGLFTIIYAPWLGWIFILVGAVFYYFSLRGNMNVIQLRNGAIKTVGFFLFLLAVLFLLNLVTGYGKTYEDVNKGTEYYDRLAALPMLEMTASLTCISAFFLVFGRRALDAGERVGLALPLIVLAVLGQVLAPTATYFLSLPVLLLGISTWVQSRSNSFGAQAIILVLNVPIIAYMIALGHLLLLGVGTDHLFVAAIPAMVGTVALAPLYPGLSGKMTLRMALIFALLALILAIWIRVDPVADTVPNY